MFVQTEAKRTYTREEYLAFEVNSDTRHEYRQGAIVLMTGGTPEHNEIASILNAIFRMSLKGQPYSIFVADQRLWIPDRDIYAYPDVMVVKRPLKRQSGRNDTVMNPVAIAEVLSKSTQSYDRDEKFSTYQTIPSFQEYLLIDQYAARVEQFSKTDADRWLFTEHDGLEGQISMTSLPIEFQVSELYEGIEFGL